MLAHLSGDRIDRDGDDDDNGDEGNKGESAAGTASLPSHASLEAAVRQWASTARNLLDAMEGFNGDIGYAPEARQAEVDTERQFAKICDQEEARAHLEEHGESEWLDKFDGLLAYKMECASLGRLHDWTQVGDHNNRDGLSGEWCEEQRNLYCNRVLLERARRQRDDALEDDDDDNNDDDDSSTSVVLLSKIHMLRGIGFVWYPTQVAPREPPDEWRDSFDELRTSVLTRGGAFLPTNSTDLGLWAAQQRMKRKDGTLASDRAEALNGLGFRWDEPAADWNVMIGELKAFRDAHGDCLVPAPEEAFTYWKHEQTGWWETFHEEFGRYSRLWWWAQWVRAERKRGIFSLLTPEQVASLDSMGFIWSTDISMHFARCFRKLKLHWKEHGTCHIKEEHCYVEGSRKRTPVSQFVINVRRQYGTFQERAKEGSSGYAKARMALSRRLALICSRKSVSFLYSRL